jgi:hypothetical protein
MIDGRRRSILSRSCQIKSFALNQRELNDKSDAFVTVDDALYRIARLKYVEV